MLWLVWKILEEDTNRDIIISIGSQLFCPMHLFSIYQIIILQFQDCLTQKALSKYNAYNIENLLLFQWEHKNLLILFLQWNFTNLIKEIFDGILHFKKSLCTVQLAANLWSQFTTASLKFSNFLHLRTPILSLIFGNWVESKVYSIIEVTL